MGAQIFNAAGGFAEADEGAEHGSARLPSPLLAFAPGSTKVLSSSLAASWRGILLERHFSSQGERAGGSIDRHVVSMFSGSSTRFEYRAKSGECVVCVNRPGTIMITPAGPMPDLRLHAPSEFIHCALEESFVRDVAEDLGSAIPQPVFRSGIQERSIQRILGLLIDELEAVRPLGKLYVDSLTHALGTRYVSFENVQGCRKEQRVAGLVPRILSRVREKIEANLDANLSLEALAEESGYSRAHFLRMFRTSTGVTPHQYVMDLRLRRAQDQLRQRGSSIIDVAVSCGFSSQSHMTSLFRQRLEMTPGEYRRNA